MSALFPDTTPAAAFLESYKVSPDLRAGELALSNAAYVYDNALAAIAFVACRRLPEARRIADALIAAITRDRFYKDGRVRNAYRAGPVASGTMKLHGWWDPALQRWIEDPHHVVDSARALDGFRSDRRVTLSRGCRQGDDMGFAALLQRKWIGGPCSWHPRRL
jgi:hypothetical protein